MKQNSNEHTSNSQVDDSMKDLVLAYIKAKNADNDARAEELQFHPDPTELWREFHLVVAPVVVREAYDYEQQYDDK